MSSKTNIKKQKNFSRPTPEQLISNALSYKYTEGGEFTTLDGHEYIGEYHRFKDGRVFTGPKKIITGIDNTIQLLPYYSEQNNFTYDKLSKFEAPLKRHIDPTPIEFVIAADDPAYDEEGFVMRYFIQKRGPGQYAIEIDQEQRNRFGSKDGIDSRLYNYVDLRWQLTGSPKAVERENKKHVNIASTVLPDLPFVIRNYTQYIKPTEQTIFNTLDPLVRKQDRFLKGNPTPIKRTYDRTTGKIIPPKDP